MRKSMTIVHLFGKIKSMPKRAYNFGHISFCYLNNYQLKVLLKSQSDCENLKFLPIPPLLQLEVCVCPNVLNGIRLAPIRVNESLKNLEVLLVRILAPDFSAVPMLPAIKVVNIFNT